MHCRVDKKPTPPQPVSNSLSMHSTSYGGSKATAQQQVPLNQQRLGAIVKRAAKVTKSENKSSVSKK